MLEMNLLLFSGIELHDFRRLGSYSWMLPKPMVMSSLVTQDFGFRDCNSNKVVLKRIYQQGAGDVNVLLCSCIRW